MLKASYSDRSPEIVVSMFVAAYQQAVSAYPFWAIDEAFRRYNEGKTKTTWNPAFCPRPAELAGEIREIISPYTIELRNISKVLEAEVYEALPTQEQRDVMKSKFNELLHQLGKLRSA